MSDPKLVSPLLDGFVMGGPMSNHDGICCCPAMKENTEDKYIVKVISIPASQVQLDALLLTGAYKDPAAAMDYFKELSDGIIQEAELLQKLSKLEGFVPYEGWQVIPLEENRLGYQVYLLSRYRQSLEKFMRRNSVTHLGAVNLGLDLCAALSVCRNAGYLYADLRPANIYISGDKEYRIGDLGFVSMASMKYASLPAKYLSPYTPPELHDAMATVNTTMDIYAVGMILYQIYNNGVLPFAGKAPEEELASPLNADYEIAEIIMKAISPDPANRWQDPAAMGQALVSYMQRNVINDVPISPPLASIGVSLNPDPEPVHEEQPAETASEASTADVPAESPAEEPVTQSPVPETEPVEPQPPVTDPVSAEPEPGTPEDHPVPPVSQDDRKTTIIPPAQAPRKARFSFFEDDEDEDEDDFEDEAAIPEAPKKETEPLNSRPKKKKKTGLVILMVVLLLIAALCYGGYYLYRNYYQQTINELKVTGDKNQICVTVDTDIDPTLLTIVCSDSYGNTRRMTLTDGQALFTDLSPDTMYQIHLEISGYHELVGPKSSSYTTAAETKISNFTGITGTGDGTVVLSFSVEGPESEWILRYSAEDEEEKSIQFSGHMVSVTDLTVGKTYTFTLEPAASLYIVTETTLEFTASSLVLAEDLEITACSGGQLTAQWTAPEDTVVESWNVLCYGDGGYRGEATTSDTTFTFPEIDPSQAYTVEVTAAGMTQPVRASITANAITVGELHVDESDPEKLVFTWDYEGEAPASGWLMMYTIDGNEENYVVQCSENTAQVSPRIPRATYTVTIMAADATTIFTTENTYTCPDAEAFSSDEDFARYKLRASRITANMLVTPKSNWSYKDVSSKNYTTSFKSGQSISILLHAKDDFYIYRDEMRLLYVIRDEEGKVITSLTAQETAVWYDLWYNKSDYHYCELDIPNVTTEAGTYPVDVYFNGYTMCSLTFTIS